MLKTTLGQVLINEALPEDLRDYNRVLDKKGIKALGQTLAEKHPDKYRSVMKRLFDTGRSSAYSTNGLSFGLDNLRTPVAAQHLQFELRSKLRGIMADSNLDDKTRNFKILQLNSDIQKNIVERVFQEAKDQDNPLAYQVLGTGRGNKFSLNSVIGADIQYVDHRDEPIPIPVMRSYSQGLRPAEYFAGAFGARKGVMDTKGATADAGFFGKQLSQVAHRLLVTADDEDDLEQQDTAGDRGFPTDVDDPDNEGALLARGVGAYKRNTVLTPKIIKDLRASGFKDLLVRSPLVGGPEDGGVFAKDVGYREKSRMAPIGDYVGLAAAQALAEPVSQSQLSSKHTGGVAGADAGAVGGFKAIDALVQVPKKFPGGATHAQNDGTVKNVREAPQGGFYVTVNSDDHYIPAGVPVSVKSGDEIEAGDVLSEGVPNPAEIVKHKGIGEGRRYFVNALRDTYKNSGIHAHRRNVELVARGLINHVRLTDEYGEYSPDDVVPYSTLERGWKPRAGAIMTAPKSAVGHYLEKPALHYSIGTRIGKKVVADLDRYGIKNIQAHKEPPPFQPEMVRGMANVGTDPDWMTKMLGSYQKSNLLTAVQRGGTSDTAGSSFVPGLARGETFGLQGPTAGWKPENIMSGT